MVTTHKGGRRNILERVITNPNSFTHRSHFVFYRRHNKRNMAGKGEGPAIGIDLETTYSCVGVLQHDRVEIIANDQGNRTTPSYVGFTDSERLIGNATKNQVAMNPINNIFGKIYYVKLKSTGKMETVNFLKHKFYLRWLCKSMLGTRNLAFGIPGILLTVNSRMKAIEHRSQHVFE